jgi:hypothetical protein
MAETTGSSAHSRLITKLFRDRESAESAYHELRSRGYDIHDINLLMLDETRKKHFVDDERETELGNKALEDAGKGAAIGGTVGATLAAIAAIGTSIALPGLGLIVAGPLAAALAGAGAGGATGGIIGALIRRRHSGRARQALRVRPKRRRHLDGHRRALRRRCRVFSKNIRF